MNRPELNENEHTPTKSLFAQMSTWGCCVCLPNFYNPAGSPPVGVELSLAFSASCTWSAFTWWTETLTALWQSGESSIVLITSLHFAKVVLRASKSNGLQTTLKLQRLHKAASGCWRCALQRDRLTIHLAHHLSQVNCVSRTEGRKHTHWHMRRRKQESETSIHPYQPAYSLLINEWDVCEPQSWVTIFIFDLVQWCTWQRLQYLEIKAKQKLHG